ncbi:hypothetical protein [Stieleria mannarensis]|uniref:hypothetical protein n=1 Tax=Stieleria mannarensis TaxID=2755585 RepID=UPI0025702CE9|nr:hypothetical protein [Rhodopirellula sp. JC639]
MSRTVRGCWLLGDDAVSGKNFDYRKDWIENQLRHFAAFFGIDLPSFAILSNHFHLVLRSRPDVVDTWDDTEVARRWLMICPERTDAKGDPMAPSQAELDGIRNVPHRVAEIRLRLSNISWWMRLLNQRIAQRANNEDEVEGHFFQGRFKAVPLVDEEAILACSVYVDLNLIRACVAETLEMSDHTSAQRRIESVRASKQTSEEQSCNSLDQESIDTPTPTTSPQTRRPDAFLSPVNLNEAIATAGPHPSESGERCSDKGFVAISEEAYLQLLDWTARQLASEKPGKTPSDLPPILKRLGLSPTLWFTLVANFSEVFSTIAGRPEHIDHERTKQTGRRFYIPRHTRMLFGQAA